MLRALPDIDGSRKLRLWCVAWARLILTGAETRIPLSGAGTEAIAAYTREVDAAEAFADGLLTRRELHSAKASSGGPHNVFHFASSLSRLTPDRIITLLWEWVHEFPIPSDKQLAAFISDIFGNPFHPVSIDQSWLTPTVLALAQQMYDSRDFSAMPILADALQDADCDNEDVLNHCRQLGEHIRGCFVVDLLLGK
ncbi:MAG TPA: hypothetical protein VG122_20635 [Gemmata sp.]|jgi:hypothetical protein|nr:hypothetical protein [Gemmata sp.]